MPITGKHAFILGAGFSGPARCPLQSELLGSIRAIRLATVPVSIAGRVLEDQSQVLDFLDKAHFEPTQTALEDIFTLLDETVLARGFYKGYSWRELDQVGAAFQRCINYILNVAEAQVSAADAKMYDNFARWLIKKRSKNGQLSDTVSIISTNWDGLVERAIYRVKTKFRFPADIDFCCYTQPMAGSQHVPSVKQKASGIYNLKLIKLHGSCNWLRCPHCQSVFTGIGSTTPASELYSQQTSCPHCVAVDEEYLPQLEPFLITPTFKKVFDNAHIRTIWHNAHIEISESDRITFIGYSLRDADFSLRSLLKRSLRPDASIEVVLSPRNNPFYKSGRRKLGTFPESRYRTLLGTDNLTFNYTGAAQFISDNCS